MKLRKLVSVAMAGVMTLSLAACGGSGTADTTAAPALHRSSGGHHCGGCRGDRGQRGSACRRCGKGRFKGWFCIHR